MFLFLKLTGDVCLAIFLKFSHDDNDHGEKEKMATRIRDLELNKEVKDSELKK